MARKYSRKFERCILKYIRRSGRFNYTFPEFSIIRCGGKIKKSKYFGISEPDDDDAIIGAVHHEVLLIAGGSGRGIIKQNIHFTKDEFKKLHTAFKEDGKEGLFSEGDKIMKEALNKEKEVGVKVVC